MIKNVTIVAYTGTLGTANTVSTVYPENVIPNYSFCKPGTYIGKISLKSVLLPDSVVTIGEYSFRNCSGLNSIIIPSSVTSIGSSAFYSCTNLTSIDANKEIPINLSSSTNVFFNVNKTACTLHVPYGSSGLYAAANQWQDFTNIVEMSGITLSATTANVASSASSTVSIDITSNVDWTVSSDQTWLTVSLKSGNGNQTLILTAEANFSGSARTAIVTVSATGVPSQTITVTQITLDNTAPIIVVTAPVSPVAKTFTVGLTFSEIVSGVIPVAITVTGGTLVGISGSGATYLLSITAEEEAVVGISIANTIVDASGNKFAGKNDLTYTVGDFTAPILVVTAPVTPVAKTFTVGLTFSEIVSGIVPEAITVTGGTLVGISGSGATYLLNITAEEEAVVRISIANTIVDASGNKFAGKSGLTYTVGDFTAPVLIANSTIVGNDLTVVLTFSADAIVTANDITIIGASPTPTITNVGNVWTVKAKAADMSTVDVAVAKTVTDEAGNKIAGVTSFSYTIGDNTAPMVAGLSPVDGTVGLPEVNDLKITFTEAVMPGDANAMIKVYSQGLTGSLLEFSTKITIDNLSPDNKTVSVFTSKLTDQTNYFVMVDPGLVKDEAGNLFAGILDPTVWNFKIGDNKISITAGGLSTLFTAEEIASITKLTLTGTIDARDFKTMRDKMPALAEVDLSGAMVVAYTGTEGTFPTGENFAYPANEIPPFALGGKKSLTSIKLPTTVTSIGDFAFNNCSGLSIITLPSSVISIGEGTFNVCENFVSITIPASVASIGIHAFEICSGNVIVDENNQNYSSIDGVLFNKNQDTLIYCPTSKTGSYIIPLSVTCIGNTAFTLCKKLTSITIPSSVTSIEYNAFSACMGLTSITVPSSITSIGEAAFSNCSNLSSINIPSSVTSIGNNEFAWCNRLTSVIIPSSVTFIGHFAFSNCSGLSSITTKSQSPINLNSSSQLVFLGVDTLNCILYVPYGSKAAYQEANQWQDFTNIVEMPGFALSATTASIAATTGSTASVELTSNTMWTASSDQTWLTVSPVSGTNNSTLTFTAEANTANFPRTATVTISATDIASQNITVTQDAKVSINYHFTPIWTGNGTDHMNINIYSAKLDGVELEAGDEIGIFDGTICVGAGILTSSLTQTNTLDISVSRNDGSGNGYTSGDAITYKLYDKSQDLENSNISAVYANDDLTWSTDGKFAIGVTSFAAINGVTKVKQDIALNTGWNIISANVVPANLNLKDLFQSLIDAGKLKKVMDEAGKTIENFGAFGGWKNNIGNLNTTKGYKVNVTAVSTLSLEGTPVPLPLDIPMNTGWNIISYPSSSAQDAKALVQSLIDAGKLKKVMDETGKTIENFGAFGGWKNNIGNFMPGKGYKVNVLENCTLTIPASGTKAATLVPELLASEHFKTAFIGNGTDQMSINLVNLQASGLQASDEIGVFDGENCVGSATIGAEQLMDGSISIAASANDGLGEFSNGFIIGKQVTVKLYRDGQTYPLALTKLEGQDVFDKNASLFAQVSTADVTGTKSLGNEIKFRCYPNPFSEQITIEIQSTSSDKLEVNIYDMDGKLVRKLYKGQAINSGTLVWNGRNEGGNKVVQGTYLINANGRIEKVVLKN